MWCGGRERLGIFNTADERAVENLGDLREVSSFLSYTYRYRPTLDFGQYFEKIVEKGVVNFGTTVRINAEFADSKLGKCICLALSVKHPPA
jgi:hypothetical protein